MKSNIICCIDAEYTCDNIPSLAAGELIEIGVTTINFKERKIIQSYSLPIKSEHALISDYCTKLTGWTKSKLNRQGMNIEEAYKRLYKYGCYNRLLVVDTKDEIRQLNMQFQVQNPYFHKVPLGDEIVNVSTLFNLKTKEMGNFSLEDMMDKVGLKFEGLPHRASVDSFNIAKLFLELIK